MCHGGVALYGLRAVLLHIQGIQCTIGNACVMHAWGYPDPRKALPAFSVPSPSGR